MKKRVLSMALAVVTLFGLSAPSFAAGDGMSSAVEPTQVEVEGTNDVGELLAKEMTGTIDTSGAGNHISDLLIDGNTAAVEYTTDRAADVVVAIYDENSGQMRASGTAHVAADSETVYVTIEGQMPNSFLASVFLLDAGSHEPLCPAYKSNLYTAEMQRFLATTTADYDQDLVLNLDNQEDTNFMVYSEDTVLATENGNTNVLRDNKDGTYTITNADSTFTSLKAGDVFSYTYSDGTILLVKAATVTVSGTTVTVTEDKNTKLEDVFDYIKIESGTDDWVSPASLLEEENAITKEISFNESTGTGGVKFSLSGGLKAVFHYKVYYAITAGDFYIGFQINLTAELHGSISASTGRQAIDLAVLDFTALEVLHFRLTPRFVYEASGSITYDAVLTAAVGYACDNGNFIDRSSKPKLDMEMKLEAKLYVGLELEARMYVMWWKDDLYASMTAEAGGEVTGVMSYSNQADDEKKHSCAMCVDGEIVGKASVKAQAKVFGLWSYNGEFFNFNKKITDFYYSIDSNEFGWTTCPHIQYKVTLTAVDETGAPVSGAKVMGTGLSSAPVTDESGTVVRYLPNGTYELTISQDTTGGKLTLTVKDKASEGVIVLAEGFNPDDLSEDDTLIAYGDCGENGSNLRWKLSKDGTLTITGIGNMTSDFWAYHAMPWSEYRDLIKSVDIQNGVTRLGSHAFYDCVNLQSVSIPESVTDFFSDVFSGCTSLSSVTIPNGIKEVSAGMFKSCSGLIRVILPPGLKSVSSGAFSGCTSLESIALPQGVTNIGPEAFKNCSKLKDFEIPNNLESIGSGAFLNCSQLPDVEIPPSVKSIGSQAFQDCPLLTDITIPDGIQKLPDRIFSNCTSLTNVRIPDSVTILGEHVFGGCVSLNSIDLPEKLEHIGCGAFGGCSGLEHLVIPETVTFIDYTAFTGCSSLTEINIPDNVGYIGPQAFNGCKGLTYVELPSKPTDSLTKIQNYTFQGCTGLTGIFIPKSVTTIEVGAFNNCPALTDVYYEGTPEQWSAINLDRLNNDSLVNATLYFNCTGLSVPVAEEPTVSIESENVEASDAAVMPESTAEPNETAVPTPETVVEPTAGPEIMPSPEPTAEPEATATPAPTPEATAVPTPLPVLPEITVAPTTGLEPDQASQEQPEGDIELVAVFSGSSDGQTALFSGLRPGRDYVILVVRDASSADLLAAGNLLFIAQMAADENGNIALAYIPKNNDSAQVRAYGPWLFDLGDTDHSGVVTLKDVTRLYQHVQNQNGVPVELETGDVTGDGMITDADVQRLFQFVSVV